MIAKMLFMSLAILAMTGLSFAADTANVALFVDSACTQAAGQPWSISLPFSPKCQSLPTQPPRSVILDCETVKGNTNFTMMMYNDSSSCSATDGGVLQLGLESYGTQGTCLATKMFNGNKEYPVYSIVKCTSTSLVHHQRQMKLHSVVRSFEFHHSASFGAIAKSVQAVVEVAEKDTNSDESHK